MKKTKIIVTVGPASKEYDILKTLITEGADAVRVNMTYADHTFLKDIKDKVNQINTNLNKNISVIMDTRGPDITIGSFSGGQAYLQTGDKIRIYMQELLGDKTKFSVSYPKLVDDIRCYATIKLNDGLIELKVIDKELDYLLCEVITGGTIYDNKTLNVINTKLNLPFLSNQDKEDIEYANKIGVDFLALSFVSSSEDILTVNDLLINLGNDNMGILAKIENKKAVDDIDEIMLASDGIIVARGDLGVEIPMERVPGIQKSIINKCHIAGKVSIVATEMMASMEEQMRPTRAEVSDVANAVLDSCDAVMLSGETTIGKFPVETVSMMCKIIESSEIDVNYYELMDRAMRTEKQDTTGMIAYSVTECADRLKTKAIVTPTISGYTAKKMSRFRPSCPIIALCPDKSNVKSLSVFYGIYPVSIEDLKSFDQMMSVSKDVVTNEFNGILGEKIIITGGYPFRDVKHTNFMKIEEI